IVGVSKDRECWSICHTPGIAHRVEIDLSFRQEALQAGIVVRILCRLKIMIRECFFYWLQWLFGWFSVELRQLFLKLIAAIKRRKVISVLTQQHSSDEIEFG